MSAFDPKRTLAQNPHCGHFSARLNRGMPWEMIAILLIAYVGAYLFFPYQIMLATSGRVRVDFNQLKNEFCFRTPARLALCLGGLACSLILGATGFSLLTSIQCGVTLFTLYMLDFFQVERIALRLR